MFLIVEVRGSGMSIHGQFQNHSLILLTGRVHMKPAVPYTDSVIVYSVQ